MRRSERSPWEAAVADLGLLPALGALACAAARRLGLTCEPEALLALTGSALFETVETQGVALPEALILDVCGDPGRLGELYAAGLAGASRKRHGVFYTPAWVAGLALDHPPGCPLGSTDSHLRETRTLDGGQVASAPRPTDRVVALATATEGGRMQAARWLSAEAAVAKRDCPTSPLPRDTVLDPACGGGRFLLAAFDRLRRNLPAAAALSRLCGLDVDPTAVALTRAALYLRAASRPGEPLPVAAVASVGDLLAWHGTASAPSGFGVVAGNPPFRGGRHVSPSTLGEDLHRRFRSAEYQVDPYVLFLEAGLAALRPGGHLCLVVPNSFMSNLRARAIRSLLAGENALESVLTLPPETFGAGVETVIVRASRGGRTAARVPVWAATPTGARRSATLLIPPEARGEPWPLERVDAAGRGAAAITSATPSSTFGAVAEVTRGINPYHHTTHSWSEIAARVHHAATRVDDSYSPELRGRDLAPFRVAWAGHHWIRYGPWLKEPRAQRFFEGPRLLVRKILGPTLVAAYLEEPFYCDQSVYILKLQPTQPWPPLALLACLGSAYLVELLRARHQEHDRLFPQLKVAELRGAPLPDVAPDSPEVASLARLMAEHLERGAPPTERQAIDAAVAALYLGAPGPIRPPEPPRSEPT